jgi:hypothetical protein
MSMSQIPERIEEAWHSLFVDELVFIWFGLDPVDRTNAAYHAWGLRLKA